MLHINIVRTSLDFQQISGLANAIWPEHYTSIIGAEQVVYMLNKFQSISAIEQQVKEGAAYYLLIYGGNPSGYFCINKKKESVFLSKLYILKECRGKGIGKIAMGFIQARAEKLGYDKITLTVNKNNHSAIKAYGKLGFVKVGTQILDIGNNYVMDDYLLEKEFPIKKAIDIIQNSL